MILNESDTKYMNSIYSATVYVHGNIGYFFSCLDRLWSR